MRVEVTTLMRVVEEILADKETDKEIKEGGFLMKHYINQMIESKVY